jgi:hypothetical protein
MNKKKSFLFRNGLSIVFVLLLVLSLGGQIYTGWQEHNEFLAEYKKAPQDLSEYLKSGHFIQATFENWESEFLQMALFVIFTIFLRQQGSSESKEVEEGFIDESQLKAKKDSPWAVKRGGIILTFYKHSLSIALFLLFVLSFFLHWYGSWLDHNEKEILEGRLPEEFINYIGYKKLWFESFQNWQSEFLSVFSIVFLSIYLRQIGSSQSKKVNDSHQKTGEA